MLFTLVAEQHSRKITRDLRDVGSAIWSFSAVRILMIFFRYTSEIQAHSHSSRCLNDHWDIKDGRATTFLHSSLSSVFRRAAPNPNTIHSDILYYSHLFFCLPFILPPCTVPCMITFASPVDLVMCPYDLNLHFLTVVIAQ